MRLWLDTEFNGYQGELISIALVDEPGNAWYAVLPFSRETIVPWVAEHVVPALLELPKFSRWQAQHDMAAFLAGYDHIHIIADWPEDIQYFWELYR